MSRPFEGEEMILEATSRPRRLVALRELWGFRDTVLAFAERDIRVQYKQAVFGRRLGRPPAARLHGGLHAHPRASRQDPRRRGHVRGLLALRARSVDVPVRRGRRRARTR